MEFEKCIFYLQSRRYFLWGHEKTQSNNFWQIIDCKETVVRTLKNDAVREQKKINLVIAHNWLSNGWFWCNMGIQRNRTHSRWLYIGCSIWSTIESSFKWEANLQMTKTLVYERSTEDKPHFLNGNPILRRTRMMWDCSKMKDGTNNATANQPVNNKRINEQ